MGNLISLITSKARLYLELAVVAAVVTLGCVALSLYWRTQVLEANAKTATAAISTLQGTVRQASADNAAQSKAINDLVTQRAQDAFAMQALSARFDAFAQSDALTRSKLNDLVKNNAQVRDHRSQSLPVDLQRLLNSTADPAVNGDAGSKGNAAGTTPATLSPPQTTDVSYEWRRGRRLVSMALGCAELCGPHGCGYQLVQA
jgi:hypothetical protein